MTVTAMHHDEQDELEDRRTGRERRAHPPLAPDRGMGDWVRWIAALIIACVVTYFTASQRVESRLSAIEAKVEARDAEILRFMQRIDSTLSVLQQQERARRD
jgi:hypothetical protein